MLKKIDVKSLFGLYSYSLDFTNSDDLPVKFITGPNGYGKTTILSLINSLCRCRFDAFLRVPFNSIKFYFDNETVELLQTSEQATEDGPEAEKVDESHQEEVSLVIRFNRTGQEQNFESKLKAGDNIDHVDSNLKMFLSSLSCYYIKDQRLKHKQLEAVKKEEIASAISDSIIAVKDNSDDLCKRLQSWRIRLLGALNVSRLDFSISINEVDYNNRKQQLLPILEQLRKFGLADEELTLKDYSVDNVVFISAFLVALEKAAKEVAPFVKSLETFFDIIERSCFANKKMEINPRYGYRFVMDNELHTILSLADLSSGEQHILIQSYELLFKAQSNALVLVDEPEMSFHLMWQMDFLKNLKSIMAQSDIQCIIATHSPQIFSQDWKLTVDLYKQSEEEEV